MLLTLSQCQIGDSAGEATVAVVEGVQGNEPEMGDAGAQKGIEAGIAAAALEPGEKVRQLRFQPRAGRGFEMDCRAVDATGNHLHGLFATQCTDV